MLSWWLELSDFWIFLTLVFGFFAVAAAIWFWSFSRWTRPWATRFQGVAPSYFSVPAVLLALLTGFVANDTWERQRLAARLIQSESEHALAAYDLAGDDPATAAIRDSLRRYVADVLRDEWPKMAVGLSSSKVDDDLLALLRAAAKPDVAKQLGAPIQSALLDAILNAQNDRGERLAVNQHPADGAKWLALLILGVLTQMGIGIVHLERPRAQLAALFIFTTGLVSTLGLVAIHEWPFEGTEAVKPTALATTLSRMSSP